MSTLIVFATKYGCTEKCAAILSEKMSGPVDLLCLQKAKDIDLSLYDKVIVGGSIYAGTIRKEVTDFCTKNLNALKGKKLGLFICCMREGEEAEKQLRAAFPQELLSVAAAKAYLGGGFDFKKMNFLERLIVKRIAKVDKDVSNLSEEGINQFVEQMA